MRRDNLAWAVIGALLIALMLAGCNALPHTTERDDATVEAVALSDAPCEFPDVLAHVPRGYDDLFRGAIAIMNGEPTPACWRPVFNRPALFLQFPNGDSFYLRESPAPAPST